MSSHQRVTKFFGHFLANILYKYFVTSDEAKANKTLGAYNFAEVTLLILVG